MLVFLKMLDGWVWGSFLMFLILGVGLYLMIGMRFMPLRKMGRAFRLVMHGGSSHEKGDIQPYKSLLMALSATVGTGNVAGVATAVFVGGPGALFWMWCTAVVGMATKFSEAYCAVRFRTVDSEGHYVGGPMYAIKNGLSKRWHFLAPLFAGFAAFASLGIGDMVQANSVANVLSSNFSLSRVGISVVLVLLVGLVLVGGVKRIADVAMVLFPVMALLYVVTALIILGLHLSELPSVFEQVFTSAFTPTAEKGGFLGATVLLAMRYGVARGIFSNEAGLGSAAMAHAAAKTKDPVRQGLIAMLGVFVDTIVICSLTGLVLLVTHTWASGKTSGALTFFAFESALGPIGGLIVAISLSLFAFSTLLVWYYYGERCFCYFFPLRFKKWFAVLWLIAIPIGALSVGNQGVVFVWTLADIMNALMALPNLIALLLLSPLIFSSVREFMKNDL